MTRSFTPMRQATCVPAATCSMPPSNDANNLTLTIVTVGPSRTKSNIGDAHRRGTTFSSWLHGGKLTPAA
jgi:hypothetical protein